MCQTGKEEDELLKAWSVFQEAPTSENPLALYQALPENSDSVIRLSARQSRTLRLMYEGLHILEARVGYGDRNAVKVAFHLHAISDGDFAEWLDIMLGLLIRPHPQLFLEELKEHHQLVPRLDVLLGNLGPDYVDRHEAQLAKLKARIEALKSVSRSDLDNVRDECIAILERQCITRAKE